MLTKRVATVFIDSSERVINSFYRDKGNPLDPISKRHLTVTCQTLNEAKLTGNMKGSPCMHRKLVRKTKMDKTHRPPPGSALGPIYCSTNLKQSVTATEQ